MRVFHILESPGILFFLFTYFFYKRKNGFIFSKDKLFLITIIFAATAVSNKIFFSDNLLFSFSLNDYLYGCLELLEQVEE